MLRDYNTYLRNCLIQVILLFVLSSLRYCSVSIQSNINSHIMFIGLLNFLDELVLKMFEDQSEIKTNDN